MNAIEFSKLLIQLNACEDAKLWAIDKSFKEVWETCRRGDWMLWLCRKMMDQPGWPDLRNLTAAKVKCARLIQHLMKDERSIKALDVAQAFSEGNATEEEMKTAAAAATVAAADAAYTAAADAATATVAAYAATAAATVAAAAAATAAADAAYTAAAAATVAADAAYAATAAATVAAYAKKAKREEILLQCADICREILIVPNN